MRNPKAILFFRKILNSILPEHCRSCGEFLWEDSIPFFCDYCWSSIRPIHGPLCRRCSQPFGSPVSLLYSPKHQCANCRTRPPAFTQAWTIYPYKSPLKEAIGLFKYKGKISLTGPLADLVLKALPPLPMIDVILPVPLHPIRFREREFNQSLLLANQVSRQLTLPLSHSNLVRVRPTIPQTSLKRNDRLKNLRRSFVVTNLEALMGKNILLVDDVFTTGTTVNECAKTLRKVGAGHVYVVTLARMV